MGARNCGYSTVEYNLPSFVQSMQLRFQTEPCGLCGKVHPLNIHSYPLRSYRDPESGEDEWIKILVCYCEETKTLGLQYTRRLLPDFLIPMARMRLDKVVAAGREKENGSTLEKCCRIIGCSDPRTARMHLKRLEEAAKAVALTLAESLSAAVHLHDNSDCLKPHTPLERLSVLYRRQEETQLRSGGESGPPVKVGHLLQAALRKNYRKNSMSYVSRPPPEP